MGFQHLSPEERSRGASKAAKALWNCSEERKRELLENSFHGKEARRKSLDTKEELGSLKASWDRLSPEKRQERIDAAAEGLRASTKQHSESMTKYWRGKSEVERYEHYLNSFGSEESCRTRRRTQWDLLDEEQKREWVRVHLRGMQHQKTDPEFQLERYLDREHPGEYKYVGSSKEFSLGGKFPDFININGKKEVIEVFGTYWHDEDEVEEKKAHYRKYGFDCKVIWDYECYDKSDIERILA